MTTAPPLLQGRDAAGSIPACIFQPGSNAFVRNVEKHVVRVRASPKTGLAPLALPVCHNATCRAAPESFPSSPSSGAPSDQASAVTPSRVWAGSIFCSHDRPYFSVAVEVIIVPSALSKVVRIIAFNASSSVTDMVRAQRKCVVSAPSTILPHSPV